MKAKGGLMTCDSCLETVEVTDTRPYGGPIGGVRQVNPIQQDQPQAAGAICLPTNFLPNIPTEKPAAKPMQAKGALPTTTNNQTCNDYSVHNTTAPEGHIPTAPQHQHLQTKGSTYEMQLQQLRHLYPQIGHLHPCVMSSLAGIDNQGALPKAATGGSISAILGNTGMPGATRSASPNVCYGNPLSPNAKLHPQNLHTGGVPGHHPEFITGATGHYVKGKGDGQSDDIPAMLADGEYVFDADTVAALGNGSSDAGAKLLDHFREALREHKRAAPSDKIPPAASPLQYMKEALKRHKGK